MKQINSGQIGFSENGEIFQTVLGSCISVCIFDQTKKIGGMIHYLLPFRGASEREENLNPLDYGNEAIPLLLKKFKDSGSQPKDLKSYVIGGAEFNRPLKMNHLPVDIGAENIKVARKMLKAFRIPIEKEKVGTPSSGIVIRFNSQTGEIFFSSRSSKSPSSEKIKKTENIKVMIVDDSAPIRKIIRASIENIQGITIVGEATNPIDAEQMRRKASPDIMTLDIEMPKKDGISYLKELNKMGTNTNVILISDVGLNEVAPVLEGLDIGAFEFLQKPAPADLPHFCSKLQEVIFAAKKFAERKQQGLFLKKRSSEPLILKSLSTNKEVELITIGSSTGGTAALRTIFADLPEKTPPILVVQHMPPVFSAAFSQGLNDSSRIAVKEAAHGDVLQPNTAYIAPGGQQMSLIKKQGKYVILITDDPPVNRFKPSVDFLFESIARLDIAKKTRAALLTGMGDDGARGLLALKNTGSITMAQNEETCVVYGMPKVAIEIKAADKVLPLTEIWHHLLR